MIAPASVPEIRPARAPPAAIPGGGGRCGSTDHMASDVTRTAITAPASAVSTMGGRNVTAWSPLFQPVAELFDRHDCLAEEGKLLAQPADVDVHGTRASGVLVSPDVGQKQITGEHPAAV